MDTQQQALPADIEAVLVPQSSPSVDPLSTPAVDPAQTQVVATPAPVPAPQPPPVQTVPLPELLEQRHARQLAEYKQQQAESRLAEIQRALEAQYRAQQPPQQPLDPVGDPEGFARALLQRNADLERRLHDTVANIPANMTELMVRDKFGDQAVDEAVEAAKKAKLGTHFMQQPNPYKSLMEWRTQQTVAEQVGPDLNAFKAKVREEVLAEIRSAQSQRALPQNLPPSLSTAARANGAGPVVMDSHDFFKNMLKKA